MLQIELPWPPSVNAAYRTYQNRVILSAKGRAYKALANELLALFKGLGPDGGLFEKRLDVRIDLFPPDKRKRDIDNLNKLLLDSLEGHVFKNDNQIDKLTMVRGEVERPNGRVLITVKEYEKDAFDRWIEPFEDQKWY